MSIHPALAIFASLLIATHLSASELPRVLVTQFIDETVTKSGASNDFEERLTQELEAAANLRAAFYVGSPQGTLGRFEAVHVRELAASEEAQFVVVGSWRSSPEASRLEGSVELRSGHSGAASNRYLLDIPSGDASVGEEARRFAQLMLKDLDLGTAEATPPPESAPGDSAPKANPDRKRTDFLRVSRDEPIEISSEELELIAEGDTKHLIFTKEVSVIQGNMRLFAGRIEAIYPDGASQPDRLNASHNVRVVEGDIEVHCREATYLRNEEIVICRGDALLVQGCDEVRGNEIEFRIREERVKVTGAASVVLRFDLEDATSCHPKQVAG